MNQYKMLFVQISTPTTSMYRKPTKYEKYNIKNNQFMTETLVELTLNFPCPIFP